MTTQESQDGEERAWWWKTAASLDAAYLNAVNATTHNVDDPKAIIAFVEKLREAQALLYGIFRAKGLVEIETPPTDARPVDVAAPEPSPEAVVDSPVEVAVAVPNEEPASVGPDVVEPLVAVEVPVAAEAQPAAPDAEA